MSLYHETLKLPTTNRLQICPGYLMRLGVSSQNRSDFVSSQKTDQVMNA
jgi:hypothetical protein